MKNNVVKTELNVINNKVSVMIVNNTDYISLTDLARYANPEEPKIPIQTWMRNKDVVAYLGLWESIHNENFKGHEFTTFEKEAGKNSFYMSPQKWIKETNAIGIISKSGNNGGTYAHSDIALEFASWLSPEFKLYVIQEFERLKRDEAYQYKVEWQASRLLSKLNYVIHTDAIKSYIVPTLTEYQKKFVYANEADVLNVALFGMTAKELLVLGVINYKLDSGNTIRVYDLDKTICDIIKKKNTLKLYEYAKKMNIYNKVKDTFEVFG